MMENIIRFDWAAKRMLRDKANFAVLEGLVTVLLNEEVKIVELLESESNMDDADDKFNRVDIKARNSKGEIILVEIQQTRELYYLQRILYGVSKAICEHMMSGDEYKDVKKVYSINILYFDLGKGADYLYQGKTSFVGVHTHDELKVSTREKDSIIMKTPEEIFPEYFLIRVNEFNKVATTPLEEWIAYLKNGQVNEHTTVPGLREAKEKMQVLQMTREERNAYERHLDNIRVQKDVLETKVLEGIEQGRKQGLEQGRKQGRAEGEKEKSLEIARKMKAMGMDEKTVSELTGLSEADVRNA